MQKEIQSLTSLMSLSLIEPKGEIGIIVLILVIPREPLSLYCCKLGKGAQSQRAICGSSDSVCSRSEVSVDGYEGTRAISQEKVVQ